MKVKVTRVVIFFC